jgi:hypothetical protein
MSILHRISALVLALSAQATLVFESLPARALEGGVGAYLLGSRDTFAGIVPAPGTTCGVGYCGAARLPAVPLTWLGGAAVRRQCGFLLFGVQNVGRKQLAQSNES